MAPYEHADAAVDNAIARVTGGNFQLDQRLFAQIERIVTINKLPAVTTAVVTLARERPVNGRPSIASRRQCSAKDYDKNHSKSDITVFNLPKDVVADPFAGRGTTAAVAARLGRIAWTSDRDPTCVAAARAWVAREQSPPI